MDTSHTPSPGFTLADAASATNPQNRACPTSLVAWNLPDIDHGFMTREGGVSRGPYRSFNLAEWVGDDAEAVRANWECWRTSHPARVARLQQVHGNQVHTIGSDYDGARRTGDGMVTAVPGLALGIFTADCVPVLLVDSEPGVVGALHAGWRGTLANIVDAGIRAMVGLGARPEQIRAALGPSIGLCCFEVDTALTRQFVQQIPPAISCSRPGRAGKSYLDLRGIVRQQLLLAGVMSGSITDVGPCTRCSENRFFSRRAAGGASTGLQMSFIGLRLGR
jgi:polyphenol oxidase